MSTGRPFAIVLSLRTGWGMMRIHKENLYIVTIMYWRLSKFGEMYFDPVFDFAWNNRYFWFSYRISSCWIYAKMSKYSATNSLGKRSNIIWKNKTNKSYNLNTFAVQRYYNLYIIFNYPFFTYVSLSLSSL